MVKKLFKYDAKNQLRSLLPMYIVLLGIAVLNRTIGFFETDSTVFDITYTSSTVFFVISCIVCLILTVAIGVRNYWQNLFKAEGYLTFTLPVKKGQIIRSKLLSSLLFTAVSLLVIAAGVCIVTSGDLLCEILKAVKFEAAKIWDRAGFNLVLWIIEAIVCFIIFTLAKYLEFYASISIGQMAKKKRLLASCGVFFGFYFIRQIIGTVIIILATIFFSVLDKIAFWMSAHRIAGTHIVLCLFIVIELIGAVIYSILAYLPIKKKLNLE